MNSQLIGSQLKSKWFIIFASLGSFPTNFLVDEAGDMLKKIKRSQEAEKELRDFKKLSVEVQQFSLLVQ